MGEPVLAYHKPRRRSPLWLQILILVVLAIIVLGITASTLLGVREITSSLAGVHEDASVGWPAQVYHEEIDRPFGAPARVVRDFRIGALLLDATIVISSWAGWGYCLIRFRRRSGG